MASKEELKEFQRKAAARSVQPIPPPPKFPLEIWKQPAEQRVAATDRFNKDMTDWSKNLAKERTDEIQLTEEQVKQLRGPKGKAGKDGVTKVVTETITRVETVPPIELTLTELGVKQVFLSNRTDSRPGTGKLSDPFDVSTPDKFRDVMRDPTKIGEYYDIILLPGVYLTRGFCHERDALALGSNWRLREGCRLRGCGMERTTLKLVEADIKGRYVAVLGGYGFNLEDPYWQPESGGLAPYPWTEVSDMTIDLNYQGQGHAELSMSAVYLVGGNYTRISKVRVINAGSNCVISGSAQESFLLVTAPQAYSISPAITTHSVIEDCIVEKIQRNESTGGGITCIGAFGGNEAYDNGARAHNVVVRGNTVDGLFADGTLAYPGSGLTTKREVIAIGMTSGHSMVLEQNHVRNAGVGFYADTGREHEAQIRNNTVYNCVAAIYTNFQGQSWGGGGPRWGLNRLTMEGNEIALMTTVGKSGHIGSNGIILWDFSDSTAGLYQFGEVICRGNKISLVDNDSDAANVVGVGIGLTHAENFICEDNCIRIPNSVASATGNARASITVRKLTRWQFRNNRRPEDNSIILPYSTDQARYLHDLEFEQKKAMLMQLSRF